MAEAEDAFDADPHLVQPYNRSEASPHRAVLRKQLSRHLPIRFQAGVICTRTCRGRRKVPSKDQPTCTSPSNCHLPGLARVHCEGSATAEGIEASTPFYTNVKRASICQQGQTLRAAGSNYGQPLQAAAVTTAGCSSRYSSWRHGLCHSSRPLDTS